MLPFFRKTATFKWQRKMSKILRFTVKAQGHFGNVLRLCKRRCIFAQLCQIFLTTIVICCKYFPLIQWENIAIYIVFFFFFYISECNFNTVAGSNHCEVIQVRILVNNHQAVSRHGTHKTVSKAQSYFPTTPRQEADLGLLCTGQIKCWHLTMEVKALPLNSSWYCPHIPVYATQNLAFCLNTKKEKHFVFKLNKILIGSPSLFIKSLHLALH